MPFFQPSPRYNRSKRQRGQYGQPQFFMRPAIPQQRRSQGSDFGSSIPGHLNKLMSHAGKVKQGVEMFRQVKAIMSIFKS
jgi:hypothetical protein